MNLSTRRTIYTSMVILFFGILCFGAPLLGIAATTSPSTKVEVLEARVDVLQKINEQILHTVYWTLATVAAIFIGLISVNLYFNIRANKREIDKIKENVENLAKSLIKTAEQEIGEKNNEATQKEIVRIKEEIANITTSAIKTSEANLIEKTNAVTKQEIEKASKDIFNSARNEILTSKAEITKLYEESGKIVTEVVATVKQIVEKLPKIDIQIKELEAYKFSKEGKLGAIMRQIDLLEYDLSSRLWYLEYRLPVILEIVKNMIINDEHAEKLKILLGKIKDEKYKRIVKEILNSIVVKKAEATKA